MHLFHNAYENPLPDRMHFYIYYCSVLGAARTWTGVRQVEPSFGLPRLIGCLRCNEPRAETSGESNFIANVFRPPTTLSFPKIGVYLIRPLWLMAFVSAQSCL